MPDDKKKSLDKVSLSQKRPADQQTSRPVDKIQLSQLSQKHKKTRLRLLLWIGICLAILIGLIVYASFRAGGIQNLFQGDGNIITNTVNNVGSAIVNPTPTTTTTPTVFTFEISPTTPEEKTLNQNQNTLVLTRSSSDANIKVKKGTYVLFTNGSGKDVGLQFSDGRQYRMEIGEQENIPFFNSGTITFTDVIDSYVNQIKGTITVID